MLKWVNTRRPLTCKSRYAVNGCSSIQPEQNVVNKMYWAKCNVQNVSMTKYIGQNVPVNQLKYIWTNVSELPLMYYNKCFPSWRYAEGYQIVP